MSEQIRKQIADLTFEYWEHRFSYPRNFQQYALADQILDDVKASRGGGKCPECMGDKNYKVLPSPQDPHRLTSPTHCPTCKGSGTLVEEKSLGTILAEGEWK